MNKRWMLALAAVAAMAAAAPRSARATDASSEMETQERSMRVDVNSASKADLMTLPGVGDAYAQKIIDNRPYRTKTDLLKKKILPRSTYNKIRNRIVAHGGQTTESQQGGSMNQPSSQGQSTPDSSDQQNQNQQQQQQQPSQQQGY